MLARALAQLRQRRLLAATTFDAEKHHDVGKRCGAYLGIDPTADGLHVGHLAGLAALRRMQLHGFAPVALIGGFTALIGDPSGRTDERKMLSRDQVEKNVVGLRRDLEILLDFEGSATLVNNVDWFGQMSAAELIGDIGKHFMIAPMLSRDTVRSRLDHGLTFTEFSYQLLQGYDFCRLYEEMNVGVQIGGSDQWGNILSGIDLIKRQTNDNKAAAFGVTVPLLTTKSGEKFGKTAGNAIWLSPDKTSHYEFFQFFLRTEDDMVEDLLFKLTDMESEQISEIMKCRKERFAQYKLARWMTRRIRGEAALKQATVVSDLMFGNQVLDDIDPVVLEQVGNSGQIPMVRMKKDCVKGIRLLDLARKVGMVKSNSEARKLARKGGFYVNNQRVEDVERRLDISRESIQEEMIALRSGKREYFLVKLVR